jgi:TM2 domain-containing membrane protein YozV
MLIADRRSKLASAAPPPSTDAVAMMTYDAMKKSVFVAYLFWFFLGYIGAHRFYLGHLGSGLLYVFIIVASVAFFQASDGASIIAAALLIGLWWLVDALLIPTVVRSYNTKLVRKLGG